MKQIPTLYTRRLADVILVTQAQLTPIVAAEDKEPAGF